MEGSKLAALVHARDRSLSNDCMHYGLASPYLLHHLRYCMWLSFYAGAGGLSVLRTFRLLRVFKLARNWKELNRIMNAIFRSFRNVSYLSALLLLFLFVFALMGMQLFGYNFSMCDLDEATMLCPPGLDPVADCPSHFDCYVPCQQPEVGTWFRVPGKCQESNKGMACSYHCFESALSCQSVYRHQLSPQQAPVPNTLALESFVLLVVEQAYS